MRCLKPEFCDAIDNFGAKQKAELLWHGVAEETLYSGASVAGHQHVETHDSGLFDIRPSGEPMYIVPVGHRGTRNVTWECIDDLVAFRLDRPDQFWRYTELGQVLNYDGIGRAEANQAALRVHRNPLNWLRYGCEGVVVLDWVSFSPRLNLTSSTGILVDDDDYADLLKKKFRAPRRPDIRVRPSAKEDTPGDQR